MAVMKLLTRCALFFFIFVTAESVRIVNCPKRYVNVRVYKANFYLVCKDYGRPNVVWRFVRLSNTKVFYVIGTCGRYSCKMDSPSLRRKYTLAKLGSKYSQLKLSSLATAPNRKGSFTYLCNNKWCRVIIDVSGNRTGLIDTDYPVVSVAFGVILAIVAVVGGAVALYRHFRPPPKRRYSIYRRRPSPPTFIRNIERRLNYPQLVGLPANDPCAKDLNPEAASQKKPTGVVGNKTEITYTGSEDAKREKEPTGVGNKEAVATTSEDAKREKEPTGVENKETVVTTSEDANREKEPTGVENKETVVAASEDEKELTTSTSMVAITSELILGCRIGKIAPKCVPSRNNQD